ncbi:MAG: amidohydrolase family protein [Nocardioidaceae bacterium]
MTGRPAVQRVDAHHHVWDLAVRDQPWTADLPPLRRSFDLRELRPQLAAHGIDATVVVQTVTAPEETPELLALTAEAPVVGVVGWVDLSAPDVADRLAELRGMGGGGTLVGIRHQVQEEADPRWLCRPDVRRGLSVLADADLAYDLLIVPHQLPAAVETTRALPGLRFVLDHAGKPAIADGALEPWRGDIWALAASPNVAVKLSGLVTEADHQAWTTDDLRRYADVLIESFGAHRMMFGSDWPVCLLAAGYSEVVAAAEELVAGLSPAEWARVFGGTAARWYRLEPQ